MRRYEMREGTASKFWEVEVRGPEVVVRFGRIGTTGQTKTQRAASPDAAQKAAEKLDAAMLACDAPALARLSRFPVGLRQTSLGERRAYDRGAHTQTDPRAFPRARDLPCAWAFFEADGDEPRRTALLETGIAPSVVRVIGGAAIAIVYWELAWRADRWQLVSIDSIFFE